LGTNVPKRVNLKKTLVKNMRTREDGVRKSYKASGMKSKEERQRSDSDKNKVLMYRDHREYNNPDSICNFTVDKHSNSNYNLS